MKTTIISANELKQYIQSSKSCSFTKDGVKLEPRFGKLSINLSSFTPIKCELKFKRVSGNGKTDIIGNNTVKVVIASKAFQNIIVSTNSDIDISRPGDSTGEVILSNITIHGVGNKMAPNWKDIIRRCGKYKNLRLASGKLFASIGGFIDDSNIISQIETNPPGMFTRDNGKIKFIGSCEITKIELKSNSALPPQQSPYVHREAPTPIIAAKEINKINHNTNRVSRAKSNMTNDKSFELNNNIVFNSTAVNAFLNFNPSNKLAKSIKSNGKNYLLLRKGGRCSISVSELKDNTSYIVVIRANKLNGNGKIIVAISNKENNYENRQEAIFSGNVENKYITLETKSVKYGEFHKINIAMHESSNGEVLIEEVLIVENLGIVRTQNVLENTFYSEGQSNNEYSLPSLPINLDYDLADPVYQRAKQYAKHYTVDIDYKINVEGSIATTSNFGMAWIKKVIDALPNVRIINNKDDINNKTLVIGKLGNLIPANKLWIDAFDNENIIQNDIEILKSINKIFSPSLPNINKLKELFPQKQIELCMRPLVYTNPKKIQYFSNNDFALYFHRGYDSTNKLINLWEGSYPKLAIIGARGSFPDFVMPINEYIPFDSVLYIMRKCKFIVDFPINCHYESSFLNLAMHMGIPIISSNWIVMNKDNCVFLPASENVGSQKIPTSKAIKSGIDKALQIKKYDENLEKYRDISNICFRKLFD